MKHIRGVVLSIILLSIPACIFGPSTTRVMSYRNGNIYLSNKIPYKVGELPPPWQRMKVRAYAIAFHNPNVGATISTDAFCGPGYDDAGLKILTNHLISGVEDYQIESRDEFTINERGALRTIATGKVDGVPLTFDFVVLNKNKCNFDFMCIVPRGRHAEVAGDFENFFGAFRYE